MTESKEILCFLHRCCSQHLATTTNACIYVYKYVVLKMMMAVKRCHTRRWIWGFHGAPKQAIHCGFETQGTHHQKSKTRLSVAPQKDWLPPKYFKKLSCYFKCLQVPWLGRSALFLLCINERFFCQSKEELPEDKLLCIPSTRNSNRYSKLSKTINQSHYKRAQCLRKKTMTEHTAV